MPAPQFRKREIVKLKWAELREDSPWPKVRLTGSKARGKSYERKFGKHLRFLMRFMKGTLFAGQWIAFEDANGGGNAQPDFFIVQDRMVMLFEVKLRQTDTAELEMMKLYAPLLQHIYQRPVAMVQVFKSWRYSAENAGGIENVRPGMNNWHWLGY